MAGSGGGGSVESFLKISGKKTGPINSESIVPGHVGELQVLAWTLGASLTLDATTKQAAGRRSWTDLTLTKHVDRATALLYQALITNDEIKAELLVRTIAETPIDTLKISIDRGRVHSVSTGSGGGTSMSETVTLSFTKINIDYMLQGKERSRGAAVSVSDELAET